MAQAIDRGPTTYLWVCDPDDAQLLPSYVRMVTLDTTKEIEMSVTSTTTIPARRSLSHKVVIGAIVGLATAALIGLAASQLSTESNDVSRVTRSITHEQFVELNTTAMPPIAATVGSATRDAAALERFIALNTVQLPQINRSAVAPVSDKFLYWNVDAFPTTTAKAPDAGESTVRTSGPR